MNNELYIGIPKPIRFVACKLTSTRHVDALVMEAPTVLNASASLSAWVQTELIIKPPLISLLPILQMRATNLLGTVNPIEDYAIFKEVFD